MKSQLITSLSIIAFLVTSAAGQTGVSRELKELQDQRDKAVSLALQPINQRYSTSLQLLLRRAMLSNDLDTANKVRAELQKLGVTASTVGAGSGTALGPTDETKRNALRTQLRDTKWKLPAGKGSFELHADGSTTSSWHEKKGRWKVTGPNTAEMAITNSGRDSTVTFDDDATTATFTGNGDVAKRIQPAN